MSQPVPMSVSDIEQHAYLVGGAVRDTLLGIEVKDRDWVVVGVKAEYMEKCGFQRVGQDFPVFLHPETKEEYALARQERKTGHGYQGFSFEANENVTLEEDLIRRDITINAMAMDHQGSIIDPFNGQADLANKVLRHVSDAFIEDPLRVLRVARFHARYANLGFQVASETKLLMQRLAAEGELEHLVAERIWLETEKALGETRPDIYFTTLKETNALQVLFPELEALDGVPQSLRYHPEEDTFIHTLYCLRASVHLSKSIPVRYAVLVHDLGKALTDKSILPSHTGHEEAGIALVKAISDRLKVSKYTKDLAIKVCQHHLMFHRCFEVDAQALHQLFKNIDAFRQPETFSDWLLACQADQKGVGRDEQHWEELLHESTDNMAFLKATHKAAMTVQFAQLPSGLKGPAVGEAFAEFRVKAIQAVMDTWAAL